MAGVDGHNLDTVKKFVDGVLDALSAYHDKSARHAAKKLAQVDPQGHRRQEVIGRDRSFLTDAEKELEHRAWVEFESTTALQDIRALRESLQSTRDIELYRALYFMMFVAGYSAEPLQELFTSR